MNIGNSTIGIQQALLHRVVTGRGSGVRVSLLDSSADEGEPG